MAGEIKTLMNEITGDLFACAPTDALVHCVSKDLAMGKGIAVEFKRRFGLVAALKKQNKGVGEVASLLVTAEHQKNLADKEKILAPSSGFEDRHVYYMITKERYFNKPTISSFTQSLTALKDQAVADKVFAISMPRIGCGLDKLEWPVVKKLILGTFEGTGITINVYTL